MVAIRYPRRARIGAFTASDWTLTSAGLLTLVALPDLELQDGDEAILEIRAGTFRLGWSPLVGTVATGATFQINQLLEVPPTEGSAVRVWIRLRVGNKVGLASDQKSVTFNYSTGSPTPVVTGVFASAIGTTTATANWTVNTGSGTSYVYTSANASESVATVKASGASQAVSAVGAQTRSLTGLTASTAYYLHVVFNDGSTDSSVSSAAFTTQAVTPPATGDADVTVSSLQALTNAINAYAAADMGAARIIDVTAGTYGSLVIANKTFSHRLTIRSASGFGTPAIFSSFNISNTTPLTLDQIRVTNPSRVTGCPNIIINGCEIFLAFDPNSNSTALDVETSNNAIIQDCAFQHGGANSLRFQWTTGGFIRRNVFEKTTDDCMKMNGCTGVTLQWNLFGTEIVPRFLNDVPHWDSVQLAHTNNDCIFEKNIFFPMQPYAAQGLFHNRQSNQAIGKVNTGNIHRQNFVMTSFRNGIYFNDKIGGSGSGCTAVYNTLCYVPFGNPTNGTVPGIIVSNGYSGVTVASNFGIRTAASQSVNVGTGGEEYQVPGGSAFTGAMNLAARCKGPTWNTGDPLSHWEPLHGASETQSYLHSTPVGCHELWQELTVTGYPFLLAAEAAWNRTANSDSYFTAA